MLKAKWPVIERGAMNWTGMSFLQDTHSEAFGTDGKVLEVQLIKMDTEEVPSLKYLSIFYSIYLSIYI